MARARQTVGDAVASWLPDHIGHDHFAANYTQSYNPGLAISATGFAYAPCIISNVPVGAIVAPAAISISPLGVYITPEGANFQPEGFKVRIYPACMALPPLCIMLHCLCRQALPCPSAASLLHVQGLCAMCLLCLCSLKNLCASYRPAMMTLCRVPQSCRKMHTWLHNHGCSGRVVVITWLPAQVLPSIIYIGGTGENIQPQVGAHLRLLPVFSFHTLGIVLACK